MKEVQNSDILPKLRTYKTYKNYFKQENYLSVIKDCRYMTSLVRFCISSHNLKIETGRYTRPKTEIYQRICTYCNSHKVENEAHFLCKCTYFTDERIFYTEPVLKLYIKFKIRTMKILLYSCYHQLTQK